MSDTTTREERVREGRKLMEKVREAEAGDKARNEAFAAVGHGSSRRNQRFNAPVLEDDGQFD
jgi:hypothetical protein